MQQLDRGWNIQESIETAYGWRLLAVTLVVTSLSFGAVMSIPILLRPIADDWNTSIRALSLVHMSAMVGAGFGSLMLGRILDRWGFFPMAIAGALATAGGLMIASGAHQLMTLHLAYGLLIGGIGQAAFFSPIAAEVSRWFDRHRPLAIAVAASGQGIGGLTVPLLLSWWTDLYGWRASLFMYGAVAGGLLLACAFVFRRLPPLSLPQRIRSAGAREPERLDRRRLVILVIALSLTNFSTFMILGHLSAFGEEQGFSSTRSSLLLSTLLGVTLISRLSVGAIIERCGHFGCIFAASLLLAVGTIWLANSTSYAGIAIGALLIGLGFGAYLPGYAVIVREKYPTEESGRRISDIYFIAFMTAGAGSLVGGWLRDVHGQYWWTFQVAAVIACLGVGVLGLHRKSLHLI